uniref:Zinc finger CCCH domain-containing protein 53 n=1 Tax=Vitis vinifera TaxID=29760 RepID=F6GWB3_VITVI
MDSYEATRIVFSRIQALDPENASKIMGYILLIQDHGEKEMIRLAFGPETLLHNLILKAKTQLGILSNTPSTPTSPSPFNPISKPTRLPTNNGFNPSSSWPVSGFSDLRSPNSTTAQLSYAAVVNGATNVSDLGTVSSSPASIPYYNNCSSSNNSSVVCNDNVMDDYQLQDHLSFLNDASKPEDLFDPRLELAMSPSFGETQLHRRSYSFNDACYGSDDGASGFGWKPCLYFARGFCKNGNTCKFLHGGFADSVEASSAASAAIVGSPGKLDGFEQEMLRSQQQRLAVASQLMAGLNFPYNKCMNFFMQQNETQRSAAAALMMGEELHKFGRCRPERNDFSGMGLGGAVNPGSRQIYLTFPADSTFREEDVSNYFSIFGPVQDVRIPYQQKRMFGFVTFVYPETVKLILAKGNPHFVCDSRVLVKPYKEKGKVPEKKQQHQQQQQQQQQQLERGEYSTCSSPSGIDPREPYDLHLGARMFYNTQEMLLRRKLEEQADLQQAIELQGRRLMNLQLLDLKNHQHQHQHHLHNLSGGAPVASPSQSSIHNNQSLGLPSDGNNQEVPEENSSSPAATTSPTAAADKPLRQEVNISCNSNSGNDSGNNSTEESSNPADFDLHERYAWSTSSLIASLPLLRNQLATALFSPQLQPLLMKAPQFQLHLLLTTTRCYPEPLLTWPLLNHVSSKCQGDKGDCGQQWRDVTVLGSE